MQEISMLGIIRDELFTICKSTKMPSGCYDKVIEIDAGNIDAWNDKGRALYNMQKFQDAISCYDKALEIDPRYVYAWNNKALSFGRITKI